MKRVITSLLVLAAVGAVGCQQRSAEKSQSDVYAISVTDNGFEPAETQIPKGRPVTLVITRKTDQTCATEVVFASLNQRYALPLNQPVRIALAPQQEGSISYACGMNMVGGKIIVR
jgi:plastocyanin domain-containing protein